MADIAMCDDVECPSRASCHRYCTHAGEVQAYGGLPPRMGADKCAAFVQRWPIDRDAKDVDRIITGWRRRRP